jgi:hypothetical protein
VPPTRRLPVVRRLAVTPRLSGRAPPAGHTRLPVAPQLPVARCLLVTMNVVGRDEDWACDESYRGRGAIPGAAVTARQFCPGAE